MRKRAYVVLAVAGSISVAALTPTAAHAAGDTPPSAEARRKASELFDRGEALYRIGDYARAAALFEEAYTVAPHPDILWNAARSFERTGNLARAANDYTDYLAASAETAPDRRNAVKALERLAKKVGLIQFHQSEAEVFVDGERVSGAERYVAPGSHVVRVVVGGREEQETLVIEAGATRSLAVLPASPRAPLVEATSPPLANASNASPRPAPALSSGIESRVLFITSAAFAATATGFAIGFGVDTLNERSRFDVSPSQKSFDDGRDKQTRTNVAIGVAAGLSAVTAVIAIWFVDWKGKRADTGSVARLRVAASPTFLGLGGGFR